MDVLWGCGGMLGLLAIAWAVSTNRRVIKLRTVLAALALQVGFGVLVLFVPPGRAALRGAAEGVQAVIDSSKEGIAFLFGPILPKEGVVFAFQVLPVIVFFAALTSIQMCIRERPRLPGGPGLGGVLAGGAGGVRAGTGLDAGHHRVPAALPDRPADLGPRRVDHDHPWDPGARHGRRRRRHAANPCLLYTSRCV